LKSKIQLPEPMTAILSEMASRNFCKNSIANHRRAFEKLQRFCDDRGIDNYNKETIDLFFEDLQYQKPHLSQQSISNQRAYLFRLNSMVPPQRLYGARFVEYAQSAYSGLVTQYEAYLYKTGKTQFDVRARAHLVARFLQFAEQNGYERLSDLTVAFIYEAFQAATDKRAFRSIIGAFLRYAKTYGYVTVDLSPLLPEMPNNVTVPTVYSPDEIERMLAAMDRTTANGKRNYVIVLIAARLGLRACDIANLTFSCLKWKSRTIELEQSKNKQLLKLPMLEDIEEALQDYINNGRPRVTDEHVFLCKHGYNSISPRSIHSIVSKALELSGIDCGDRRRGPHALRSSLATALLREGNDYPTIQKVLGQRTLQSSKSYARADIDQLRTIALPVPLPEGQFAQLLNSCSSYSEVGA